MPASTELWGKLKEAQKVKNGDAANAYTKAIERANKGKLKDAEWWERWGDDAMGTAKLEEHATR